MSFQRLKDNLLHLNNLRKFISWEVFRQATSSRFKLQILEDAPPGKVLVLAPHPDDDVIGCGGTIKLHRENNDEVKVIYLSDGSGGFPKKKKINSIRERKALAKIRSEEAKSATKMLGVSDLIFWKYPDGRLNANRSTIKLLQNILDDYQPKTIYVPSFLDPHPDHYETAKILASTLREKSNFNGQIFSYEVWSPIFANRLINIDKVIKSKILSLKEHKSQLEGRNYLDAFIGLAQYRAGMYEVGKYAEAFFVCNKKLYLQLFNLINLKK